MIVRADLWRFSTDRHQRVGTTHDSGVVSALGSTPVKFRAELHDPVEDTSARALLVLEAFDAGEGGRGSRVGASFVALEGEAGQPVPARLARRFRLRDLETVAVMMHARLHDSDPGRRQQKPRRHRSKVRCFGASTGGCDCITEAEARDYLDDERAIPVDDERAQRERIANAWWDAKVAGLPIGLSVAKARGEGAPGSKGARNRANVYVADLRRRQILAEVGAARGLDLGAYGVES